ncbi:helix-turn-helix domain-containing protein [Enorma burkinafasonensis]|uniref:helix-turn-helix domain-containing protein n=1 Tax=Enorma burkinafasonensis TaxID=2590867 RepID=UPI00119C9C59|nr:helix-turn-helix domain-containing protein [Enorma burkinafasonensis]
MAAYLTSETIKSLRERRGLTQRALADAVGVTDKAVSKWESGRGLPDISLVEPLSSALGISVAELLTGDVRQNANRSANLMRSKFYVCPVCGNVVHALGEGSFSCCGVQLVPCEAEEPDVDHAIAVERIEDEWYVTLDHPMTKDHYISFIAYVTTGGITFAKLYPEQEAAALFRAGMSGAIFAYCNRHGLFRVPTPRRAR